MGKRIANAPGGSQIPKPLLPLDDSGKLTFLDWHLRALAAHGAREIYIVGSKATFGTKLAAMENIPATWIMNDFPGDVTGQRPLDAPRVHERARDPRRQVARRLDGCRRRLRSLALRRARAEVGGLKTLVCGRFRETDEEVMVFGDERGVPRLHGKGLLGTPMVRGPTCMGEATGLLLLEPADHATWLGAAAWCMKFSTAKTRTEHEDITQRLSRWARSTRSSSTTTRAAWSATRPTSTRSCVVTWSRAGATRSRPERLPALSAARERQRR